MDQESFHVTDPAMLRALAHPFRQRILWELSARKFGRATDLAAVMNAPANALSYHLRELAKAGLVEAAPEHARDTRDRVWRLAHQQGLYASPDSPAAALLNDDIVAWMRDIVSEELPRQQGAGRGVYLGAAMLTEAEADAVFQEVVGVLERWRERGSLAESESATDSDSAPRVFHRTAFMLGNR